MTTKDEWRTCIVADDYPVPALRSWHDKGYKIASVTLVAVEGGSPRPIGAQMLVREDGHYFGYLSGGCLEQAVVLEAQSLMQKKENRLVRYGKKSPYFDVKLPCGSGLDLYFNCHLGSQLITKMSEAYEARIPFSLMTNLTTGHSEIRMREEGFVTSCLQDDLFRRVYLPAPRLYLLGSGPALTALCQLSKAMGLEFKVWCPDSHSRENLEHLGIDTISTVTPPETLFERLDPYTAVVLVFHEHDCEPDILEKVLKSSCFYIGVLGNRDVHRQRLENLRMRGFSEKDLQRILAPVGSIRNAKSKTTLAVGIIAEILSIGKEANILN